MGEYTLLNLDYADTGRPLYATVRVPAPCFAPPPQPAKMHHISKEIGGSASGVVGRLEGHPA